MSFLGGVASAVGSIASGVLGFKGQESANAANAQQAQVANQFSAAQSEVSRNFAMNESAANRAFQDRNRHTAYTAAMYDMKQAGLNPIFAYQQGGAPMAMGSAASVSAPQGQQATMHNSAAAGMDAFGKSVSSVNAMRKMNPELKILDAQQKQINMAVARDSAATGELTSREDLNRALKIKTMHEADSAKSISEANRLLKKQMGRDSKYELDNPELMKIRKWLGSFGSILGSGNSAKKLMGK